MSRCLKRRLQLLAVAGLAGLASNPSAAQDGAYSDAVQTNCRDDYFKLCPAYALGSTELRLCMEAKAKQLSQQCVRALVASGEVDQKRVKR